MIRIPSHTDTSSYTFSSSTTTSNGTSEHTMSTHSVADDPLVLTGQMLDDLAIIDDLYDIYGHDVDHFADKEDVAMVARLFANKEKVLTDLQRSEAQYIDELQRLLKHYGKFIHQWLDDAPKMPSKPSRGFLRGYEDVMHAHRLFAKALADRMKIWGPTQLVSDVFLSYLSALEVYYTFLKGFSQVILDVHRLYSTPVFIKALEVQHGIEAPNDLLRHIRLPIQRLQVYIEFLNHLIQYTDPCHLDAEGLKHALHAYKAMLADRQESLVDADRHFRALEVSRTIIGSPVEVTASRRLLLKAKMIKVDVDNLTSTDDVYTYILYNDMMIFCKSMGGNKKKKVLQYRGSLDLMRSELRTLTPALCAKLVEVRKPILSFKKKQDQQQLAKPTAYGFELVLSEKDATGSLPTNMEDAAASVSGPTRRRHIIRTQSYEEQKQWTDTVAKVMQHMRWLHANQNYA